MPAKAKGCRSTGKKGSARHAAQPNARRTQRGLSWAGEFSSREAALQSRAVPGEGSVPAFRGASSSCILSSLTFVCLTLEQKAAESSFLLVQGITEQSGFALGKFMAIPGNSSPLVYLRLRWVPPGTWLK